MSAPALDPSTLAIGQIASTVRRQFWPDGDLPLGLTHDDLVSEGWLAWVTAKGSPSARYARARWAMVDLLRRTIAPVSGRLVAIGRYGRPGTVEPMSALEDMAADPPSPARGHRLRASDMKALRACCGRVLAAQEYRVVSALLFDGESLERAREIAGVKGQARSVRANAFQKLRQAAGLEKAA